MADASAAIESALTALLDEHGLAGPRADEAAARLILDYPLVRTRGLPAATARLEALGMCRDEAREASLELLAFELLGRLDYEQVLDLLRDHCPGRDPSGIALRAARLRREITSRVPIHEPRPLGTRVVRLALGWLGSGR